MNNINKLIFKYVLEIIIVIVLVVASYPVWKMFDKSKTAQIANSYATMDYVYLDIDRYISTDEFEDVINVKNDTNTKRGYELIVKIEKQNVDENTVVVINNQKQDLKGLKTKEDDKYNYYKLAQGTVVSGYSNYEISYENSEITYDQLKYEIIENHEV